MNRTLVFFVSACALGLVALVVKAPGPSALSTPARAPVKGPTAEPKATGPATVAPTPTPSPSPGSLSLSGKLSHPYISAGSSDVYATLEVAAVDVAGARRAPVSMALVIDRSGSMAGAKLANAKRAANELLEQLDERDALTVVHYGSDVRVLPSLRVTEENRQQLRRYIARIIDDGGTNISAGLQAGQAQLARSMKGVYGQELAGCEGCVRRLVLLSDGQPTEGVQSTAGLTRLVTAMRAQNISVTALGIGYDFNEDLMTRLATVGGGSYGYLKDSSALAGIIRQDLQQAGTQVARDVALTLRLPEGVVLRDVLGRTFSQSNRMATIALPDFSARQVEKLVVQLAVSTAAQDGVGLDIADFSLDYRDTLAERSADAKLKLAARVTEDRTLADARRDKDAVVVASRARAAVNFRRAAEAVATGDYREAKQAVDANKKLFFEAGQLAGHAAVASDEGDNAQVYGLIQAAPASEAQRLDAVKSMKVQSQRSAGAGSSLY